MGAGRPEPGPGQLQERLGGGSQTSDRRHLRRRLQKFGGALQKARSPRRQVRRKILRNKHPPSSNPSQFIDGFAFDCIHTSYMFRVLLDIYMSIDFFNEIHKPRALFQIQLKYVAKSISLFIHDICDVHSFSTV